MKKINLKGLSPELLIEHAKQLYGTEWLHVLSKISWFSQKYIISTFDYNSRYALPDNFTQYLQPAFNGNKVDYIQNVILSRFEVVQIRDNYLNGDIEFITILLDGVLIKLDFYNQKKIPSIDDCLNMMQIKKTSVFCYAKYKNEKEYFIQAEKWLSVLELCKSEELDFIELLQIQLDYLNCAVVYNSPAKFGVSIARSVLKYNERSQNQRYIQAKGSVRSERNFTFMADYAEILTSRQKHLLKVQNV
jgi:hypothetical protein